MSYSHLLSPSTLVIITILGPDLDNESVQWCRSFLVWLLTESACETLPTILRSLWCEVHFLFRLIPIKQLLLVNGYNCARVDDAFGVDSLSVPVIQQNYRSICVGLKEGQITWFHSTCAHVVLQLEVRQYQMVSILVPVVPKPILT